MSTIEDAVYLPENVLKPELIPEFLVYLADKKHNKYNTIYRCFCSLRTYFKSICDIDILNSENKKILKGIRREKGTFQTPSKGLDLEGLKKVLKTCGTSSMEYRNKIIIYTAWILALRRSETKSLKIKDLEISEKGIIVKINKSKTDQEGKGIVLGIPSPADIPLKHYIKRFHAMSDPNDFLFPKMGMRLKNTSLLPTRPYLQMSGHAINAVIQFHGKLAGYTISSHSLRRGIITEMSRSGIPERDIQRHSRHHSEKMVKRYIESDSILTNFNQFYSNISGELDRAIKAPNYLIESTSAPQKQDFFDYLPISDEMC